MLKISKIRFYEKRKIFFAISLGLILLGIVMIFVNGIALDIQFKGGSILQYSYQGDIDKEAVAAEASNSLGAGVSLQETMDLSGQNKQLVLNVASTGLTPDKQKALEDDLKAKFPDNHLAITQALNVDPFYGQEFLSKGILAIILASAFIVVFVWIRYSTIYGLSAGVFALLSLLHDLIMVFVAFILMRIPINDAFIAVVLTVLGYSVTDTVVNYDRIRENKLLYGKKMALPEMVNMSINQSLSRTINTVLTTLICMAVIVVVSIIFNLESIRDFALPMMVGIIAGCYSSIAIACPLWVMWNTRGGRNLSVMDKAPGKKTEIAGKAEPAKIVEQSKPATSGAQDNVNKNTPIKRKKKKK